MEHILKNTYWQSLLMVTFTIAQLQPARLCLSIHCTKLNLENSFPPLQQQLK